MTVAGSSAVMSTTLGPAMSERVVAVVAYDGAELLDISSVTSTLVIATRLGADPPYRVVLLTPAGAAVTCDSGLELAAQGSLQRWTDPLDTVVVSGGLGHERAAADPLVVGHVRRLAALSRRVASVCTGATILAATGLLDGRPATTHWRFADRLAQRNPRIDVDPAPIYVRDGHVYTSAGVTSALDLTLALVEEDHGPALAHQVARDLVTYLQRPGDQTQMSLFTSAPEPRHDAVRAATAFVATRMDEALSADSIAHAVGLSPRHLSRLFVEHTGLTPARYVRRARTDAAAQLIASTDLPLAAVVRRCGFGTVETLRKAFLAEYGMPPARYRESVRRAGDRRSSA